jgi:hypothetical protein
MMADGPGFRLAMRVEGPWWVAYFAKTETMDGAIEIARFQMTVARVDSVRDAVLDLVQAMARALVKDIAGLGEIADFEISKAPEHERAGRS